MYLYISPAARQIRFFFAERLFICPGYKDYNYFGGGYWDKSPLEKNSLYQKKKYFYISLKTKMLSVGSTYATP